MPVDPSLATGDFDDTICGMVAAQICCLYQPGPISVFTNLCHRQPPHMYSGSPLPDESLAASDVDGTICGMLAARARRLHRPQPISIVLNLRHRQQLIFYFLGPRQIAIG